MDDRSDRSLPIWVRSMAIVGIPGVIAFFLIWMGANDMARRSDLDVLRDRISHCVDQTERNHRVMIQICANLAKDDQSRSNCFQ